MENQVFASNALEGRIALVTGASRGIGDAIAQSFHSHSYVQTDSVATIADGIAVKAPGDITVPLIQKYADDVAGPCAGQ